VGQVQGQNKWKLFLVDPAGKEYDPEKLADRVWSYLEKTGDAKAFKEAYSNDGFYFRMIIVSINPVVVIVETHQDTASRKQVGSVPDRYYWVAQVYALRDLIYTDGLRWFSPDLKQRPVALPFSEAGVAEIPLPDGKMTLVRDGDKCKTTRE
jgi:hypothetical protein